jgi:uncharacterized protein
MFGISLTKILLTAAVILLAWKGYQWYRRFQEVRVHLETAARTAQAQAQARQGMRAGPALDAEDMTACPACGSYVMAKGTRSCGRGDCPYPG